ncbi:MAG: response regulator [Deltaproteobacteria bacterium]|jgi:DNA-binding response OmpR family regulator|nr:response regulator [Deltaproteobacteria bacterium]
MIVSRKILVLDDDSRLIESLQDFLQPHGYVVHGVIDGKHITETIKKIDPGIVLLDVMMPDDDGFTILQRLRAVSAVPIIMLTARGEEADRIVGLELGADDYLAKPFSPRELLARIKAVLRRVRPRIDIFDTPPVTPGSSPLYVAFTGDCVEQDGFSLNARKQEISKNGVSEKLSTAEFSLTFTLMTHPGQVLTRDRLQLLAFSKDDYASDRNIDVHVSRIRSTFRKLKDKPERIRTVWGTGYCWLKDS